MDISPVRSWRHHEKRRKWLGVEGVIVHFSIIHAPPLGMSGHAPYVVALIAVGGERITAQVVDIAPENVRVGMRVVGRLRKLFEVDRDAVIIYGVKFAPLE